MHKEMKELRVSTTTEGTIEIEQGWDEQEAECHDRITVNPGQVDILIGWLQEAMAELDE